MLGVIAGWLSTNAVAIVAILAGLASTTFATWTGWRIREADRRDQRQRVAVLALGAADGLVMDLHPNRLRANVGLSRERLDGEQDRWQTTVRPGLLAIALGYPTASERDLAHDLAQTLSDTVALTRRYVLGVEQNADADKVAETSDEAASRYHLARAQLDALAAAIRGEAP